MLITLSDKTYKMQRTREIIICMILIFSAMELGGEIRKIDNAKGVYVDYADENYSFLHRTQPLEDAKYYDLYLARKMLQPGYFNEWEILDSIQCSAIFGLDTNLLVYTGITEDSSYFISMRLSPEIRYDTLITIPDSSQSNWIKELEMGPPFYYSLSDSILIYRYGVTFVEYDEGNWHHTRPFEDMHVLRILPGNNWQSMKRFKALYNTNVSDDFTRLYVCATDSTDPGRYTYGTPLFYDLKNDSLWRFSEIGDSIIIMKSQDAESNLYYVRQNNLDWNLWEYSNEKGAVQLTDYRYPERVVAFTFVKDGITYIIRNMQVYNLTSETIYLD